jgi:hypothetical protein
MRDRLFPLLIGGLCAGLLLIGPTWSPAQAPDEAAPPAGVEMQARGAVHEAFAEPSRAQVAPGAVVRKAPPALIDEAPPEEKPQGDNIVWIPGYWGWDDEASEFVWISGFWRAIPPGRTWVPGSWQRSGAGWRWVSGYWGAVAQEETEYLPPPPESIDRGPSIPAPGESYSYVPGLWVHQVNRFVWRPGYWLAHRPGWVWVPACYKWTPCGFVFVPGFWDLPVLERGLLFAPVRFVRPVYLTPGFVYRPVYCIQPDFLCGAMFVRTGYPSYYFGDYFAPRYRGGFTAWTSFRFGGGVGLDLNFAYYRHAYLGYPAWERGLTGLYAGRFAGTIAAPPRTLGQQTTVINNFVANRTINNVVAKNVNITNIQNVSVLSPVKTINKVNVTALSSLAGVPVTLKAPIAPQPIRVERLSKERLQEERNQVTRFRALARERQATETRLIGKAPTTTAATPLRAKVELPRGTPPARVIKSTTMAPPPLPRTEPKPVIKPIKPVTPIAKPTTPPPPPVKPNVKPVVKPPMTTTTPLPMPKVVAPPPPTKPTTPPVKPEVKPVVKPPMTTPPPMPKVVTPPPPPPKPVTTPPKPTKPDKPEKKAGK